MTSPSPIQIVDVGPRDGLQNEVQILSPDVRAQFIKKLVDAGHTRIEVGSFVSPKWVPQMTRTGEVLRLVQKMDTKCRFSVIVPNIKGLDFALAYDVTDVAVLAAASETFSQKNTNHTIDEMLHTIDETITAAKKNNLHVRAYISCVLGCPYEGKIDPQKVATMAQRLKDMGADEISLGDTIGTGYPAATDALLNAVLQNIDPSMVAVHFHDTYGQALANISVALNHNVRTIDSSAGGLGGCPYAAGASGNVATEDVLYMLQGIEGTPTIDIHQTMKAAAFICGVLGIVPRSKVARAMVSSKALKD